MKTSAFISALRIAPNNQLIFVDLKGHAVGRGYHLTELKAASFETVDCGGQTNRWHETIVQLWVPPDPANDYMTAAKFLKIFDKARGMIPLNLDAEIRVEFGDENLFPSTYHVRSVSRNEMRRMCCSNRQQLPAKRAIAVPRPRRPLIPAAPRKRNRVARLSNCHSTGTPTVA